MAPLNRHSLAVIDALLPAGDHPRLPGALEAGFEDFYKDFQKTANLQMRAGFKAALLLAVWAAPVMAGRIPPFSRLTKEDRERALKAMASSRSYHVRQMLLLLKAIVSFSYGANPKVRQALGFPSSSLGLVEKESRS